jgi:hypothetical protein
MGRPEDTAVHGVDGSLIRVLVDRGIIDVVQDERRDRRDERRDRDDGEGDPPVLRVPEPDAMPASSGGRYAPKIRPISNAAVVSSWS